MVFAQVFSEALCDKPDPERADGKKFRKAKRELKIRNGTIMLSKPTDNWTNDVYLDPMLLFSESVPLETVYIQGLSLDDVLKSKIRHFRQLEQQTRYFEKLFEREKQAVIHEAIHLGIDMEQDAWDTEKPVSEQLRRVLQLRDVTQQHQMHASFCQAHINSLRNQLKRRWGLWSADAGKAVPCIKKVFINPQIAADLQNVLSK